VRALFARHGHVAALDVGREFLQVAEAPLQTTFLKRSGLLRPGDSAAPARAVSQVET